MLDRQDSEETLICQMIIDNKKIIDIIDFVRDEYFNDPRNRNIFMAVKKIYFRDKFVTSSALNAETNNRFKDLVLQIENKTFTSQNWEHYATIIKRFYIRDEYRKRSSSLNTEDILNVEDNVSETIKNLSELLILSNKSETISMQELAGIITRDLEEKYNKKDRFVLETGFKGIDKILTEIPREYIILGARTSLGKSSLALAIACNISRKGIKTLYFSLEMSSESLGYRELARMTGIDLGSLRGGFLGKNQFDNISKKMSIIYETQMHISNGGNKNISTIVSEIRRSHAIHGTQAFFIDHISLIKAGGNIQRHEQYIKISNELQELQRELNIYIVVVAQLGRDTEGKSPTLSSIKESGAFEQDADIIMMLHRERASDENESQILTEIKIAKNRNGACGVGHLMFLPKIASFRDLTYEEQEAIK